MFLILHIYSLHFIKSVLSSFRELENCLSCSFLCKTWPIKQEDVIKLERSDGNLVRWICNVMPEDRTSSEELELD